MRTAMMILMLAGCFVIGITMIGWMPGDAESPSRLALAVSVVATCIALGLVFTARQFRRL